MFVLNGNFSSNNFLDPKLEARLKANALKQNLKDSKDPDLSLKDSILLNQLAPGKGDLNSDGEINFKDASILGDYLFPGPNNSPEKLTDDQLKKADTNNDEKIDYDDLTVLYTTSTNLIIDSYKPNSSVKGDLNGDNKVDDNDLIMLLETQSLTLGATLGKNPSEKLIKAVDFNEDGIINNADFKILESLYTEKPNTILKDTGRPPNANIKKGDLNQDGKIDDTDISILGDALNNKNLFNKLTEDQKQAADLNNNGKIDIDDIIKLTDSTDINAFNPISGIVGDFNGDSVLDHKDLQIFDQERRNYEYYKNDPANKEPSEYMKGFLDFNMDGEVTKADREMFMNEILQIKLPRIETTNQTFNDPKNWMVSQMLGSTNPNVDKSNFNGNCGFASLVMIARMFGKLDGGKQEAQKQIKYVRELAGVPNEYEGSTMDQLSSAAESLGLNGIHVYGDINVIKDSLDFGRKIILGADPSKYSIGENSGHAIVISGFKDGMFEVYDPGFQRPIKVSEKALEESMKMQYGNMLIVGEA